MYLSEGHLVVIQGDPELRSWENSPARVGMRDMVKWQRICGAMRASVGDTAMLPGFLEHESGKEHLLLQLTFGYNHNDSVAEDTSLLQPQMQVAYFIWCSTQATTICPSNGTKTVAVEFTE